MANLSSDYLNPYGKILRFPKLMERIKNGQRVWPFNIEMDVSNRCNLDCTWCDFSYTHDNALMSKELGESIIRQAAQGGTEAITFTGGGEPTLNPALEDIVQAAAKEKLDLGIYTNGIQINPISQNLWSFKWIYVSLDAPDPTAYAKAKMPKNLELGGSLFWSVIGNIKALVAYRDKGVFPTLGVGFLLSSKTWVTIDRMLALGDSLGVDYLQFRPIWGDEGGYEWISGALSFLEAAKTSTKIVVSRQRFLDLLHWRRAYTHCRGSELVPCIGADGKLWVCPNTRGKRLLGDLSTESLASIWVRRQPQAVGPDCRETCRNHALNETLEHVCGTGPHDKFV